MQLLSHFRWKAETIPYHSYSERQKLSPLIYYQFDGKAGAKHLLWNTTLDYLKYLDTLMSLRTRYAWFYFLGGTRALGWAPDVEVGRSSLASAGREQKACRNDRSCLCQGWHPATGTGHCSGTPGQEGSLLTKRRLPGCCSNKAIPLDW